MAVDRTRAAIVPPTAVTDTLKPGTGMPDLYKSDFWIETEPVKERYVIVDNDDIGFAKLYDLGEVAENCVVLGRLSAKGKINVIFFVDG